jgi:methyltransferase (TIGR00027 family)
MNRETASRTAEYMAFFRALESARPAGRRIIHDPFASAFVSPPLRRAVRLSRLGLIGPMVRRFADRRLPGARTSAIARTRLIDDILLARLPERPRQVVLLGAGFDCRAYRLPLPDATTVFEVDHPSTQAVKIARLRSALPTIPKHVRFVGIDFNRESLPEVLRAAGFDPSQLSFFVWEGVSHYLTQEAVDKVLKVVATCGRGSLLIFTYIHAGLLDGSVEFDGGAQILQDVAGLGEPWTFGILPEQLGDYLARRGLQLESDDGARDYRKRCFGSAAAKMQGYDFYHVAAAHVP